MAKEGKKRVEYLRKVVAAAVEGSSAARLAREIGGMAPNTVTNFIQGKKDPEERTIAQIEDWLQRKNRGITIMSESEKAAAFEALVTGVAALIRGASPIPDRGDGGGHITPEDLKPSR